MSTLGNFWALSGRGISILVNPGKLCDWTGNEWVILPTGIASKQFRWFPTESPNKVDKFLGGMTASNTRLQSERVGALFSSSSSLTIHFWVHRPLT